METSKPSLAIEGVVASTISESTLGLSIRKADAVSRDAFVLACHLLRRSSFPASVETRALHSAMLAILNAAAKADRSPLEMRLDVGYVRSKDWLRSSHRSAAQRSGVEVLVLRDGNRRATVYGWFE